MISRHRRHITLCAVTFAFSSFTVPGSCAENSLSKKINDHVDNAIRHKAQYQEWVQDIWRCTDAELTSLTKQDNDSVAIASAFELFVVRPAQRKGEFNKQDSHRQTNTQKRKHSIEIDPTNAARFIGYCEGRLHIIMPKWYLRSLCKGYISDNRMHSFLHKERKAFRDDNLSRLDIEKTEVNIDTKNNAFPRFVIQRNSPNHVNIAGGNVVLEGTKTKLQLPLSSLAKIRSREIGFAFINEEQQFWVARYDRSMLSNDHVLTLHSGDGVRWTQNIWTIINNSAFSLPSGNHLVVVIRQEESVYVAGVGTYGLYIEGFNAQSGDVLMRFISCVDTHSQF